jgi:uncharacterized repeat protein (TIGR01451 family)
MQSSELLGRGTRVALLAVVDLTASSWTAGAQTLPQIFVSPEEETVFDYSEQRCDAYDLPDEPARAIRLASGVRLYAAHFENRRNVGPTLHTVVHQCPQIMTSSFDPDPSKFADYEWLDTPYLVEDVSAPDRIFGLIHNEYHGPAYDQDCHGPLPGCYQIALTSAQATIDPWTGQESTFSRVGSPPQHLAPSSPYVYDSAPGYFGYRDPSNILRWGNDYYAAFYAQALAGQTFQQNGVCIMRTNDPFTPTSWRGWGGAALGWAVRFVDPYGEPNADPAEHVCTPLTGVSGVAFGLHWSSYLRQFMLVTLDAQTIDCNLPSSCGVFYYLSSDLVNWDGPHLIWEQRPMWIEPWIDSVNYTTVLDADSPAPSFDVVGSNAYIYFTRAVGNADYWLDRDLRRRRIELRAACQGPSLGLFDVLRTASTPGHASCLGPAPLDHSIESPGHCRQCGYRVEKTVFRASSTLQPGTHALYLCAAQGPYDEFLSVDPACEGQAVLSPVGYVNDNGPTDRTIYRCLTPAGERFISAVASCEGLGTSETTLGYSFALADLSITVGDSPDPIAAPPGSTPPLAYAVAVENLGPHPASGIAVAVNLPASLTFVSSSGAGWSCTGPTAGILSCSIPSAGVGPLPSLTVNTTVTGKVTTQVTTTASVTAAEADSFPGNNSWSETTRVVCFECR